MKKSLAFALFFLTTVLFAQQVDYSLKCPYGRALSYDRLTSPKTLEDLIVGYPADWVSDYQSTSISVGQTGNARSAIGANMNLTAAQRSLLNTASVGDRLTVRVEYLKTNAATQAKQLDKLEFVFTIVPEVAAANASGDKDLKEYFSRVLKQLPAYDDKITKIATLSFTVDEGGAVTGASVSSSSGDAKVDGLLLNAVRSMPKWNPGQDRKGKRYRQEFLFEVVNAGC